MRKLETQLQLLQLLASSLLAPTFSPQRDLGAAAKRETRVLLHEAMVGMQRTQPHGWNPRKTKLLPTTWCLFSDVVMITAKTKRHKGGGSAAAAGAHHKCIALLPLLHISIEPWPGTDTLALHRRLPLMPGGRREGAVAYEWECHCGSEMIMLCLANKLEERKAALRQELFDAQLAPAAAPAAASGLAEESHRSRGSSCQAQAAENVRRSTVVGAAAVGDGGVSESERRRSSGLPPALESRVSFGTEHLGDGDGDGASPRYVWHASSGRATVLPSSRASTSRASTSGRSYDDAEGGDATDAVLQTRDRSASMPPRMPPPSAQLPDKRNRYVSSSLNQPPSWDSASATDDTHRQSLPAVSETEPTPSPYSYSSVLATLEGSLGARSREGEKASELGLSLILRAPPPPRPPEPPPRRIRPESPDRVESPGVSWDRPESPSPEPPPPRRCRPESPLVPSRAESPLVPSRPDSPLVPPQPESPLVPAAAASTATRAARAPQTPEAMLAEAETAAVAMQKMVRGQSSRRNQPAPAAEAEGKAPPPLLQEEKEEAAEQPSAPGGLVRWLSGLIAAPAEEPTAASPTAAVASAAAAGAVPELDGGGNLGLGKRRGSFPGAPPPPRGSSPTSEDAALEEAAFQAQTIARLHARVKAAELEALQLREQLSVVRQQAADSASMLTSIAAPMPPPRKPRPPAGLPPGLSWGRSASAGAGGSVAVPMEPRRTASLPPPSLPPRKAECATSLPMDVAQRSCAGREAAGRTARFANDSPSKPELEWLTAHVAQVEAAEATEAAEAIVEDSYQRHGPPPRPPMRSMRLCASAPLPPGVPMRGKKISLTLQREVSSREHGRNVEKRHPPHAVALGGTNATVPQSGRRRLIARQPSPMRLPRPPHDAAPRRRPCRRATPPLLPCRRFGLAISSARGHSGHIVSSVEPGTPAAAAGVRAGDLLVTVAGHTLADGDDFKHYLPSRDSDRTVELGLWRPLSEVMAPLQRAATLISSISTMRSAAKVPPWMPPPPPQSPNCAAAIYSNEPNYSPPPGSPGSPMPPSPPPRAASLGFTVDDISGAAFPARCSSRCARSEASPASRSETSPSRGSATSRGSTSNPASPSTRLRTSPTSPGRDLAFQAALEAVGLR